jgi:hypothetical protein
VGKVTLSEKQLVKLKCRGLRVVVVKHARDRGLATGRGGMTRVLCIVDECVFWREGFCSAEEIEVDPELGCLTLMESEDLDKEE